MKNNLAAQLKKAYKKGVEDGGLYWTAVLVIAINNLYGWTKAFDKIEAEMKRIDDEVSGAETEEKITRIIARVNEIRGGNYFETDRS